MERLGPDHTSAAIVSPRERSLCIGDQTGLAAQDIVYTGCIRSADGSLYSVREGTTPMAPCRARDTQISWNMAGQPGPQGPPGPSLPPSLDINVNCTEGQSINEALAQQAETLTISISGTCVESVRIDRDDVTLQGVGTDPTIMAPAGGWRAIGIDGAQRVRLQGLTLIGSGWVALYAGEGASFTTYQLKISNPTGDGLFMRRGAAAFMQESEMSGCQARGAVVESGSSLYLENCQVIDNEGIGVAASGSALTLDGTNVARNQYGVMVGNGHAVMVNGCTILDNDLDGVIFGMSDLTVSSCRIAGNGGVGIAVSGFCAATVASAIIQANIGGGVWAQGNSFVRVAGASTIEGDIGGPGIYLRDTCAADVAEGSSITGSPYGVICAPPPSVAQLTWPVPDTATTNCPIGQ